MMRGAGGSIYSLGLSYYPDSNVQTGSDSINGSWTYTYDDFNRLNTAVSAAGLGCAETYDRYGNRLQQNTWNGACFAGQFTSSGNNNRLDQLSYDAAGNVLNDGTHSYAYDAEGRLATVDSGNTATYVYDASGRRVRKISGGAVDYLYDLSGHVITELNSSGGWNRGEIYAGGQHVATYDAGTTYFTHADWLGTERVRSTVAGAVYSTWTSYPFGEGSAAPNPSPTHFTGKERDSESGNDYFGARYYSSSFGRFMSPDFGGPDDMKPDPVAWADYENPQTLNLYNYVGNSPLSHGDNDGHDVNVCTTGSNGRQQCTEMSNDQYEAAQKAGNGGLNVPTLDQVGMNGNGSGQFNATSITDASGNVVGTATYISDGGADYYANRNGIDFINNQTAPVVNALGWATVSYVGIFMGAEAFGTTSELTTLGDITATPTAGEISSAENTLATGGRKGVEKAIRTLAKRIAEHQEKFNTATGHTSSIETELATWRRAIVALQQVLR